MAVSADHVREALTQAHAMIGADRYADALQVLNDALHYEPQNDEALFLYGCCMLHGEQNALAVTIFESLRQRNPTRWNVLVNLGRAWESLEYYERAEALYHEALKHSPGNAKAVMGLSTVYVQTGRFKETIQASNAVLEVEDVIQAHLNKGHAYIHLGDPGTGWPLYARGVGHQRWRERKYHFLDEQATKVEPIWNGEFSSSQRVIVTAEQGVGDQIAYLSVLPHLRERGMGVAAIECYPKLRNLLASTFRDVPVYGTQFTDPPGWRVPFTHSCAMSELPQHCDRILQRNKPGPYLQPNKALLSHWRVALSDLERPLIGVAWNGGSKRAHTWHSKSFPSSIWDGLRRAQRGTYISLEYKPHSEQPGILSMPWATCSEDLESCAALIANLDAVVTVPTTVYHLAGALDVPAFVLVNERPHFHEGGTGQESMWWPSVRFFRRGDGHDALAELQEDVCEFLSASTVASR